jgi:nicotinate-nucleotide--dimethylbenzimidazole phosphoribosyltransferase
MMSYGSFKNLRPPNEPPNTGVVCPESQRLLTGASPVVLDGFISGAAAMVAYHLDGRVQPTMIAAHRSVEIGHRVMLDHMQFKPLQELDLRLGEGTGAALGISLCQAACKILDEMATFGEAGVATKGE